MDCPECGDEMVTFTVPAVAREAAPGDTAAICPACLTVVEANEADDRPEFSRLVESFPEGETGAVMAVAVGLLVESMVLNKAAIADLLAVVEDMGADPWLVLERLAASPTVQPNADLGRARNQLEQLLDR